MLHERNPELAECAAVAMAGLWAYLTPERRRDMLVNEVILYLYQTFDWAHRQDALTDEQIEALVVAAAELLDLVDREGLDEHEMERVWQHKWWFDAWINPNRVRSCVAELAKTFTADYAEAGPLIDFARDLGASDG